MNQAGKADFIEELIDAVKGTVLARVKDMPGTWDGLELRRYVAERFADAAYCQVRSIQPYALLRGARLARYKKAVLERDL